MPNTDSSNASATGTIQPPASPWFPHHDRVREPGSRATASGRRSRPGPRRSTRPIQTPRTPSAHRGAGRSRGTPRQRASTAASRRSIARRYDPTAARPRRTRTGPEPDVAEIQRRSGDHVRVLQARREAVAVERRRLRVERAGDGDEHDEKNVAIPAITGTTQAVRSRSRRRLIATASAPYPVRTSSQRSRELPALPERAQRVGNRQVAVRVRSDVPEREVVPYERRGQHCGGDEGRREAAVERVQCRRGEPTLVLAGRDRARDQRVDRQAEGDDAAPHGRGRPSASGGGGVLRRALRDDVRALEPAVRIRAAHRRR